MSEETSLHVLLVAVGSPAVVTTLVTGGRFGGASTTCLLLLVAGLAGLVRRARAVWHVELATVPA